MKFLFVSSRNIWPATGGREINIINRFASLADKYEINVFYYGVEKRAQNTFAQSNIFEEYSKKPSVFSKLFNIFKTFFLKNIPFQFCLFDSKKNRKQLASFVQNNQIDVVFLDMVRLFPLGPFLKKQKGFGGKIVIDLDDLISKRYRNPDSNILGQASDSNHFLKKIVRNRQLLRLITRIEKRRIERAEYLSPIVFDAVTLVSPVETNELIQATKKNNIFWLPMVISQKSFVGLKKDYFSHNPILIGFAGLLKTPANFSSLKHIIENILPFLQIDYTFIVIGKIDEDSKALLNKNSNVVFKGYVDDFQKALLDLDLFLCPMNFGTGIKTKILEAMAAGLPVITNNVGIEGIDASHGKEVFLFNSDSEIIAFVNSIYSHEANVAEVGRSGFNFVSLNFNKEKFVDKIETLILFLDR